MWILVRNGNVAAVGYAAKVSAPDGESIEISDGAAVNIGDPWPPAESPDVGNGNPPPPT